MLALIVAACVLNPGFLRKMLPSFGDSCTSNFSGGRKPGMLFSLLFNFTVM
jgi:hypothetical protein